MNSKRGKIIVELMKVCKGNTKDRWIFDIIDV